MTLSHTTGRARASERRWPLVFYEPGGDRPDAGSARRRFPGELDQAAGFHVPELHEREDQHDQRHERPHEGCDRWQSGHVAIGLVQDVPLDHGEQSQDHAVDVIGGAEIGGACLAVDLVDLPMRHRALVGQAQSRGSRN